jgi:hypothetical protein
MCYGKTINQESPKPEMAKKIIPTWRMFMALGQGITSVDLSSGLGDKPS